MKRLFSLLQFTLISSLITIAQVKTTLTLDESISLALKQGYAVQNATSQYLSSKKSYEATLRKLRTSVNLTMDAPRFSESLSNQFNPITQRFEFYQLETVQAQADLSISQPILWTGGTLTLRESMFRRDQTGRGRDFFNGFSVEFRQPILSPNSHRISYDRAILGLEQSKSDFLRSQLDIVYAVSDGFYSLYQLVQRMEILNIQVQQNEDSYQTAKNKYSAGLIPEVDVLQSEVDLAQSQNDLLNSRRDLASRKNTFRMLLGLQFSEEVELTASFEFKPVAIDLEQAVTSALKNRSEIRNAESAKELRKIDIFQAESRGSFRMDLSAAYGFNRTAGVLPDVFQDLNRTRNAVVSIQIPLFDWGSNALEVESAQIQYQNALASFDDLQRRIRQEITDLINRVQLAESRLTVLEKVIAIAQKSYDISLERYKTGIINRNELAQAQQRLTNAKLNNLSALIDYRLGLSDLKRKTLFDFEAGKPVEPMILE
ncbi:MAG: TolC family protein [bacterium]